MSEIVTLVDLSSRSTDLLNRTRSLISALTGTEFNLTIGHLDRGLPADNELKKIIKNVNYANVKIISVPPKMNGIELSRLRNVAVESIGADKFLLVDLDIYPDTRLFRTLLDLVSDIQPLVIAPCIYLTAYGNKLVEKNKKEYVIASSLHYSGDCVLHWAIPSSVMAVRKKDFIAIGGFHEEYCGHGYEDFDFMLHLALQRGLIKPSTNLLIDRTYRAPMLSCGFRAALGHLCIGNLLDGNIAFHLHHKKDKHSSYYQRRIKNAEIFQERVKNLLDQQSNLTSEDNRVRIIQHFFVECEKRGVDPTKFYSLFDARPRHLIAPNRLRQFYKLALLKFLV